MICCSTPKPSQITSGSLAKSAAARQSSACSHRSSIESSMATAAQFGCVAVQLAEFNEGLRVVRLHPFFLPRRGKLLQIGPGFFDSAGVHLAASGLTRQGQRWLQTWLINLGMPSVAWKIAR